MWDKIGRPKIIPLAISLAVFLLLPFGTILRLIIALVLDALLSYITWRRADGTRLFPPYIW